MKFWWAAMMLVSWGAVAMWIGLVVEDPGWGTWTGLALMLASAVLWTRFLVLTEVRRRRRERVG